MSINELVKLLGENELNNDILKGLEGMISIKKDGKTIYINENYKSLQ